MEKKYPMMINSMTMNKTRHVINIFKRIIKLIVNEVGELDEVVCVYSIEVIL